MRVFPFLLMIVSVVLTGCPPSGALVLLDNPDRVSECGLPLQYGHLTPIIPDSLNAFFESDRVGSLSQFVLRSGQEVEAADLRVEGDTLHYASARSTTDTTVPLCDVSRLAVSVRAYNLGDPIALILRGRYEDVDVLVGCGS